MYSVIETEQFANWLAGLKDRTTRARLQLRLRKAMLGHLGDHKAVGGHRRSIALELHHAQDQDPPV